MRQRDELQIQQLLRPVYIASHHPTTITTPSRPSVCPESIRWWLTSIPEGTGTPLRKCSSYARWAEPDEPTADMPNRMPAPS